MNEKLRTMPVEKTPEEKAAVVAEIVRKGREEQERRRKAAEPPPLKLVASAPTPPMELLKRLANPEKPKRDILRLADAAVDAGPMPEIELGRLKDSADIGKAATNAMKALVAKKARVFQRAGTLVQPVETTAFSADRGQIKVVSLIELNVVALKAVLMRQLKFFKETDSGKRPVNPGFEIPQLILKDREVWPFHEISGLLGAPTLRPDGSLLRTEGYDAVTGMLLLNPPHVRTINPAPSRADAQAALAVLKELLVEFPFVDEASRSVALSLIISVMVRGALDQVPLHVIAAPAAGTGKSFLIDVASMIATGETAVVVAATGSADELEKRIGAELIGGRVLISLDNINGLLSSDLLCQAVTQDSISLRPLGSSMVEKIANRAVFCANGINIAIADDLNRRTLLARMDAGMEKPWERPFKRSPVEMIAADRGRYIAAALSIPLAYLTAGEPEVPRSVNGFKRWSRFVRAPLVWLGEADPINTMAAAREGDPRLQARAGALTAMVGLFGMGKDVARTAADMIEVVSPKTPDTVLEARPEMAGQRKAFREALMVVAGVGKEVSAAKLGYFLRASRGAIVGGLRLCSELDRKSVTRWWVERVDE